MSQNSYRFSTTHEWLKPTEHGTYLLGISDHAQQALGDIVFINFPEAGDRFKAGEVMMDIESVKAASDLYCPLNAEIIGVNAVLLDEPERLNQSPYETYIVELKSDQSLDDLMDEAAYLAYVKDAEA